ncbi:hypothetical protein M231_00294 [Tremella mesenterica]|uniref:Scamp family protein n=1 Tax=Tremella mesenterica TaxID=5217 RepID=A0A4Q1BVX5_TREME|nr:uncharacterized protein TREMEDRAFT_74264 [Tremella mesenterica DSM 1558]EIW68384.1 hypothetical protein TREMEDRAFT_74264 [Tremella mesenterica DSM 1558]RXK42304.1 hypothetical protein M231_00294 [Tremella mesenterica]
MPSQSENPFDPPQPLDSNPFESTADLHSENPFIHSNDSAFSLDSQDTARGLGQSSKPTAAPTTSGVGYGLPSFGLGQKTAEQRKADLDAYEAQLREREAAIGQREREVGVYRNNWPPFFPFLHHDITTMPTEHQTVGKLLYAQWLELIVTLVINLVGCILLLISGSLEGGADVGAAGGYLPVIGVLSFILWYRPIYLGFLKVEGKAMAFFFYIYFVFQGFNLLYALYMLIGIPSTGSAGLINTIAMFAGGHIVAGVFGVLSSVGWGLQVVGGGVLYKRVWDYKNGNGEINFSAASDTFKGATLTALLFQGRLGK